MQKTKVCDAEATGAYGRLRILGNGARLWTDGSAERVDVAAAWADARAALDEKSDRVLSGEIRVGKAASHL